MTKFSDCVVKYKHMDYVHFRVKNPGTPWAYLFSSTEATKNKYPARTDYWVSKTTLEQVFLPFANDQ